mmetsp:Transcript_55917/g.147822  ORF Transcript_55917/g.147822 Transcript_55917/m.147822 type:complete len:338 (-) Transcript_55917:20-1033(-)
MPEMSAVEGGEWEKAKSSLKACKTRAVLTPEAAMKIFEMRNAARKRGNSNGEFTASKLALQYGVTERSIRDIWNGKTWRLETKHLDPLRKDMPEKLRLPGRPKNCNARKNAICSRTKSPRCPVAVPPSSFNKQSDAHLLSGMPPPDDKRGDFNSAMHFVKHEHDGFHAALSNDHSSRFVSNMQRGYVSGSNYPVSNYPVPSYPMSAYPASDDISCSTRAPLMPHPNTAYGAHAHAHGASDALAYAHARPAMQRPAGSASEDPFHDDFPYWNQPHDAADRLGLPPLDRRQPQHPPAAFLQRLQDADALDSLWAHFLGRFGGVPPPEFAEAAGGDHAFA